MVRDFQLGKMKRVLEMDGSRGCTTMRVYFNATELYTEKRVVW